jgi:hypothetical protein
MELIETHEEQVKVWKVKVESLLSRLLRDISGAKARGDLARQMATQGKECRESSARLEEVNDA